MALDHLSSKYVWSIMAYKKEKLRRIEWQIFSNTRNMEKSQKLSTKLKTLKISETLLFVNQNKKYSKKSLFLKYFKVKCSIENLKLVKLLLKFNKCFIVFLQPGICRPTLLINALLDIAFRRKCSIKSNENLLITIAEKFKIEPFLKMEMLLL